MTAAVISVLVVDDSALMRELLTAMLQSDPEIHVAGAARDPLVAREMINRLNPDVITLDIEMPNMDGLTFLKKIMTLRPMPVVMVSALTQERADITLQALELGAVDFVAKPTSDLRQGLDAKKDEIIGKVKMAARARVQFGAQRKQPPKALENLGRNFSSSENIIAIGASTGGVEAIRQILTVLPADSPATLITQHMPPQFTTSFAERLNRICQVSVCEAAHGQRTLSGHVYITPGGRHLELARSGTHYICRLHDDVQVSGHRPSVDTLFRSVAKVAGRNAIGVLLTGMGKDGARGLLKMRNAGSTTFCQDEASCVIFGMPRAAIELGAVETQLPLSRIADGFLASCSDNYMRLTHA